MPRKVPSEGLVAEFCATLDALCRRAEAKPKQIMKVTGYGQTQVYNILSGGIKHPPDWNSFVAPVVGLCTKESRTALAEWRMRHERLVIAYEAVENHRRHAERVMLPPNQLPADAPWFVGRQTELMDLDLELVAASGSKSLILAIYGSAETGKTALAIHWARRVSDRFRDGQLYVDLRGDDPQAALPAEEVLSRFLVALGDEGGGRGLAEATRRYRRRLADRQVLIVLDNARDLAQVEPLLPLAPGCRVLVTSQQPLAGLADRPDAYELRLTGPPVAAAPPVEPPPRQVRAVATAAAVVAAALIALLLGSQPKAALPSGLLLVASLAALGWSARPARPSPAAVHWQLAGYLDALAGAVQRQDTADGVPPADRLLPLCWTAADPDLRDALARTRVRAGRHPTTDAELTGDWSGIAAYLTRYCRVVFLGDSGGGKTMLARHLTRELLAGRGPDDPVPVTLRLAGWNPLRHGLYEWISLEMMGSRKVFRTAAAARVGRSLQDMDGADSRLRRLPPGARLVYELLDRQRVLPVLDGLDEMAPKLRVAAMARLNSELPPAGRVVITSRPQEYRHAVTGPTSDGLGEVAGTVFDGAAVVRLVPPSADDIGRYLAAADPGPLWTRLLAELRRGGELRRALSTPLMVWMTQKIYARRPAGPDGSTPDSLVELAAGGAEAVHRHVLSQLVPAVYRDSPWQRQAARWLAFLARHLDDPGRRAGGIAWWRLSRAARPISPLVGVATGLLVAATVGGGFGVAFRPAVGLPAALFTGIMFGVLCGRSELQPTDVELQVRKRLPAALRGGVLVALLVGGLVLAATRRPGFAAAIGLPAGVLLGLSYLHTGRADTERAVDPMSLLVRDRAFVLTYLVIYSVVGIPTFILVHGWVGLPVGIGIGVLGGLVNGIQYAFSFGFDKIGAVAWGRFQVARAWLALTGRLPWRAMAFLDDARRLGVLRQEGGVYHFRHAQLREQLATAPDD